MSFSPAPPSPNNFPSNLSRRESLGPSPLSTPGLEVEFQGIEISSEPETDHDADPESELKVTFYPPLVLQRRIWILNILRNQRITSILDIGCGEGQLLSVLAQPAPWLRAPPPDILSPLPELDSADEIINLNPKRIIGLDIYEPDLEFALQSIAPPPPPEQAYQSAVQGIDLGGKTPVTPTYIRTLQTIRWEEMESKIWLGGLEVVNEEFLDIECITSSEVIEHLPEHILPFYAPVILGIYQPRFFLITTPSYTFNARFTAPDAPPSARNGFPDPTGRTTRVFRHQDHKFEWTLEEFNDWCTSTAAEWGYNVDISSVGRACEEDPYGRDDALGGASQVAAFRQKENFEGKREEARKLVDEMWKDLETKGIHREAHRLLKADIHPAHPSSRKPVAIDAIGEAVKARMEEEREAFVRFEELWFDPEISTLCGGWIEFLLQGVDKSPHLLLQRDGRQNTWMVELIGGPRDTKPPIWSQGAPDGAPSLTLSDNHNEWDEYQDGERSVDLIPSDWIPGQEGSCYGEGESSEDAKDWESTAAEGDVSWNGSEVGDDRMDEDDEAGWGSGRGWNLIDSRRGWGMDSLHDEEIQAKFGKGKGKDKSNDKDETLSGSGTSTAGWDGDASEDTS
ncbi:hypothetical protein CCMSSC00406_0002242 [Pleurotus cornucopiae]|uniref:Uncharacterized protein n=1 Tax=Pleurotus cornucopiae TaxID=5321 RepID=A0ACB7J218_PLECO|nr:hypothetical protein CCMSSC00406_0002242 [Pleurotus cornucopiae]